MLTRTPLVSNDLHEDFPRRKMTKSIESYKGADFSWYS